MNRTLELSRITNGPRLTAALAIIFTISGTTTLQRCSADSLSDRLAGKNVPDFTVTYECDRRNVLSGSTREEIASGVRKWFTSANSRLQQDGRQPLNDTVMQTETDMVMNELGRTKGAEKLILTISQRLDKLLVKREVPARKELSVFVYDGVNSMLTYRGADARTTHGFHYEFLRDFVFPGCGVCGKAMCRDLEPGPAASNYAAMVGFNDGGWSGDGPQYVAGTVRTQMVDGIEYPIEVRSNQPGGEVYQQACEYSDYRRVGANLLLPGTIHLREWYRPGSVLPYGEQYDATYKLLSATDKAGPDSEFKFESHLPDSAILSHEEKGKSTSILYTPGSGSLNSQFKADAEKKRLAALAASATPKGRYNGSALGAIALVLAICGWYLYRRSKAPESQA